MAIEDDPELQPKKVTVGGESFEEHSLTDRIKFDEHQAAQADRTSTPTKNKMGLGIFRTRMRNGRP